MSTTIFTIGFAGSSAEQFFTRLSVAGVTHLTDIRRHNTSQLAGFTKRADLPFFLDRLLGAAYVHRLDLAPGAEELKALRSGDLSWEDFAAIYERGLEELDDEAFSDEQLPEGTALLCSEAKAEHCHRRLLAEALATRRTGLKVVHL